MTAGSKRTKPVRKMRLSDALAEMQYSPGLGATRKYCPKFWHIWIGDRGQLWEGNYDEETPYVPNLDDMTAKDWVVKKLCSKNPWKKATSRHTS